MRLLVIASLIFGAVCMFGCGKEGQGDGTTKEAAQDVKDSAGKGGATPDPKLPVPGGAGGGPIQPPGNKSSKFKLGSAGG